MPKSKTARQALAEQIGADGLVLLQAACVQGAPVGLQDLDALITLRRIWLHNYTWQDERLVWRADDQIPPAAQFVASPYDVEAHYARKRTTQWIGYKIHITESCDDELPPLITHVATTPASIADGDVTPTIHAGLKTKGLLPSLHIVDTGYLDAKLLVTSQQDYGVDLCGPTRADPRWQAQAKQGFDAASFLVDWERKQATCPQGKTSISWTPAIDGRDNDVIKIKFSSKDCGACSVRAQCTQSSRQRRAITIRPQEQYKALREARERETTTDYAQEQHRRCGIEGTLSFGLRTCELRRSRYIGLARTHLQHVLTATAMNLLRLGRWFAGEDRAPSRKTPFMQLKYAPA